MKLGEIDGVAVYVDGGQGPVLLMLHGWPDTLSVWDGQVALLQDRFRCVRITLPGFETDSNRHATSLEEMLTLFDEIMDMVCPDEAVDLLLHDWGCFFGYQYAMVRPDRVRRIVGVDIGDAGSPAHLASLGAAAKAAMAGYQLWLAAAWRIGGRPGDAMTRAMARAVRAPLSTDQIHAGMNYPYDIMWTGSHGSYREARPLELACPLLFIYGTRKPFMFHSSQWAEGLAREPLCKVTAVEAGHWVMRDQPGAVNELLLSWLA